MRGGGQRSIECVVAVDEHSTSVYLSVSDHM